MQGHSRRTVFISVAVIVVSFTAAGLSFFIVNKDLSVQVDAIVKTRELIRDRAVKVVELTNLEKDVSLANTYRQSLDALLPNEDQIYDFTRYLDLLARTHRVGIEFRFDSSVSATTESPGYATFTVGANGSAVDLVAFLKSLETQSSQYLLTVEGASISRPGGTYRLSFSGKVHTKK